MKVSDINKESLMILLMLKIELLSAEIQWHRGIKYLYGFGSTYKVLARQFAIEVRSTGNKGTAKCPTGFSMLAHHFHHTSRNQHRGKCQGLPLTPHALTYGLMLSKSIGMGQFSICAVLVTLTW